MYARVHKYTDAYIHICVTADAMWMHTHVFTAHTLSHALTLLCGDYQIYSLLAGGIVRARTSHRGGERVFRHIAARNAMAAKWNICRYRIARACPPPLGFIKYKYTCFFLSLSGKRTYTHTLIKLIILPICPQTGMCAASWIIDRKRNFYFIIFTIVATENVVSLPRQPTKRVYRETYR